MPARNQKCRVAADAVRNDYCLSPFCSARGKDDHNVRVFRSEGVILNGQEEKGRQEILEEEGRQVGQEVDGEEEASKASKAKKPAAEPTPSIPMPLPASPSG